MKAKHGTTWTLGSSKFRALLGYYNYPKALALGLEYVDSVYRISESYVLAGLLYALNCFI